MLPTRDDTLQTNCVVLNVGNIIDMRWVEETAPSAVLYAWQGGMEGGTGLSDLLLGRVSPSGKLPDTIVRSLDDYPSTPYFGHADRALYQEDIYVGTVTSRRSHRSGLVSVRYGYIVYVV